MHERELAGVIYVMYLKGMISATIKDVKITKEKK